MIAPELRPPAHPRKFEKLVADVFQKEAGGVAVSKPNSGFEFDIYIVGAEPEAMHIAIECKFNSNNSIDNISQEIKKLADEFESPLDKVIIATTNESELETRESDELDYNLEIYSWPDIVEMLISHTDILKQYYNQLVIEENIEELQKNIESIEELAEISERASEYGELTFAETAYQILLERAENEGNKELMLESQMELGRIHRQLGNLEESKKYYSEGLAQAHDMQKQQKELNFLSEIGKLTLSMGEYEESREYLENSIERVDKGKKGKQNVSILINISISAIELGDYELASEYAQSAFEISEAIEYTDGIARSLDNLGLIALKRGNYEEARAYHQESLEIKRDIGDRAGEAESLDNLGMVARNQGDYETAREYHQESLEIEREIGNRAGEAKSLRNIGNVAHHQGDYEAARDYYQQSLEIKRDMGERTGEAKSLSNLGMVARNQGDYETAREYHQESLEIKRDVGDPAGEAKSLGNLGLVAHNQGDYEIAREYHQKSLEIEREIGNRAGEAKSLGNLGNIAYNQGDYEAARDYYQQSLEIKRDMGDRAGEATSLNNLGNAAQQQGDLEEAQTHYSQASEYFLEIGSQRRALKALRNLSQVADDGGNTETAREACEQALSLIETTGIPDLDEYAREFRTRLARLGNASIDELYARSLKHVLTNEGGVAMELLENVWERRKEVEQCDEEYPLVIGAGIGFAAHLKLVDSEEAETDPSTVLSTIEPHTALVSSAARSLFNHLMDKGTVIPPDKLKNNATAIDEDETLTEQLDALEAHAYSRLLEVLLPKNIEQLPATMIYQKALVELNSDDADAEKVIALLTAAWNRRDDHTAGSDKHTAAMAAGVGLAAHIELFDIDLDNEDHTVEAILDEVSSHTDDLEPAVLTMYQHLVGDEPSTTPDELRDRVEMDSEEARIKHIQTATFAGILERLRQE